MHTIEMNEMSDEFLDCWKAAGNHLDRQVDGGIKSWLRAHPYPPFLEHLSFRLGNQLFFIRVEDADGRVKGPGNEQGYLAAAKKANGHACILPMKRKAFGGGWAVAQAGWGLIDAHSGRLINPINLVTNQLIEMSAWELHDMAVQVVKDYLKKEGLQVTSWQGNPDVDPAIWFRGPSLLPEWVVVRAVKFPSNHAERPKNWQAIHSACGGNRTRGHFASVALVSASQPFRTPDEKQMPLWRGHGMHVRFIGLE